MHSTTKLLAIAAAAACVATAAEAKCTRLAFSVNDYGKDGPTKDAKSLLDKYIAQWTAERGIKKYNVGKKDVSCELFLDFGVFDEHTCKAAATVCWGDGQVVQAKAGDPPSVSGGPAPAAAVKAKAPAAAPLATGALPAAAKPVAKPAPPVAPAAAPAAAGAPALTAPPKVQ